MVIPAEILRKKRDGGVLSPDEISWFVRGVVEGTITVGQTAAFLMASCIRGLSRDETIALTTAMAQSGVRYDWQHLGYAVDKHSTGGVGDKLSLLVAPIAASAGALVPMMSGRGLGHTGGTVDKLESIVGFRTQLDQERIRAQLKAIGAVMLAQSEQLAPADRILYALRDETGTVESVGLIVASILSKKIAEGARGLVLDVKVGRGAFMEQLEQAHSLAAMLLDVGRGVGLDMHVAITDMNDPIGFAAGNWVEVLEAERALAEPDQCPADLAELTMHLSGAMLHLSGVASSLEEGKAVARDVWHSGRAHERFHQLVAAQGGSWAASMERYRLAASQVICSTEEGYVVGFATRRIGLALVELGAGRHRASDAVDPLAGVIFHCKRGDWIERGQPLATLTATDAERFAAVAQQISNAIEISSQPPVARSTLLIETL
ncbi:MAG: thymidine phosphorylase [Candidatus Kapaibacterium sp.]|nr:MAG: thymidine phosphorylase [Candidatus Kapabacteria bacterium]